MIKKKDCILYVFVITASFLQRETAFNVSLRQNNPLKWIIPRNTLNVPVEFITNYLFSSTVSESLYIETEE